MPFLKVDLFQCPFSALEYIFGEAERLYNTLTQDYSFGKRRENCQPSIWIWIVFFQYLIDLSLAQYSWSCQWSREDQILNQILKILAGLSSFVMLHLCEDLLWIAPEDTRPFQKQHSMNPWIHFTCNGSGRILIGSSSTHDRWLAHFSMPNGFKLL